MKKYRIIMMMLMLLYICMAVSAFLYINKQEEKLSKEYRIEINRIQISVQQMDIVTQEKLDKLVDDYDYVNDVIYCSDKDITPKFFNVQNDSYSQINVLTNDNGEITGYLKYYYKAEKKSNKPLMIVEICLAALFFASIVILIYVYSHVMRPFNKLSDMPYELSKGNLNDSIKESSNRYFGKFIWGIGMLRDSLEGHKKNEYRLAKDKKMLVLSISHDIKTPLNAINLYAKVLYDGIYEDEEQKKNAAHMIQEKTAEIDGFVKEIVQTQTEDVVTIDVNMSEVYLKDLVNKVMTGYSEKCSIRHTEFIIGNYENHLIAADMDRLYEAIGNLIENAFKYGDGKKIGINFWQEDYCQLISIYNTGDCVDENEITHLFDSFFRGSNAGGKDGNGLGLYICSQIMHKMGGDIYVKRHKDGMEFVLVCEMC